MERFGQTMPATYRLSMLLGLCLAMALGVLNPLRVSGAGNDSAMLKRIASRVDGRTGVIAIEATAPVPYVASQPDAKTFVVELRDVVALGFENEFTASPGNPVADVQVEAAAGADGRTVARVRMTLDQPMRPRVRSARNVIYVEADRAAVTPAGTAAAAAATASGPSPMIRDVRVQRRGDATAVTLLGTSRLLASSILEPKDGSHRVIVNLPNVGFAVPKSTNVGQGPVDRVRIGFDPKAPLITQVSIDLSRTAPYRVEASPDGNDLTLVCDEVTGDPFSALQKRDAAATTPAAVDAPAQKLAAQAAAPTPAPAQQPVAPAQPRYTGNPVSLDFQGADLRAVLRTFSEISGLNLVIDPTIQGAVDVALKDVP